MRVCGGVETLVCRGDAYTLEVCKDVCDGM